MKQFIKFSGLCAAVLALVTFILQLATPAITGANIGGWGNGNVPGTVAIFGNDTYTLSWAGLLSWIFVLVALLGVCCITVCDLLKIKALEKFASLILFVGAGLLLVAGIFMFTVSGTFLAANGLNNLVSAGVGAGWIIGGILAILAAGCAALKPVLDLLGKK